VRNVDTLGCWIVQNPRSNRHNKVGYPRALPESARVALGTDGFVSDMREETAVLLEEALAHGEDAGVVERRAAGGAALVAELCGFATGRPEAPAISDELMDEIRAEARDAAAILWKRMAAL
jgi:cytosine/adenosine deaminase-related metal-dependent hydrolase